MQSKIRLAYVDSEMLLRDSLAQHLKTLAPQVEFTFVGANLSELKALAYEAGTLAQPDWDILLIRIDEHRMDQNLIVRKLIDFCQQIPILILTRNQSESFILSALRDGIKGFVSTSCSAGVLLEAIDRVLKGQKYFSPEITESFLEPDTHPQQEDPVKKLSKRELQVVVGLLEGLQNCQIAEQLKISSKTVSSYKARVFEKLRVDTNAELFKFAHKTNLISRLV